MVAAAAGSASLAPGTELDDVFTGLDNGTGQHRLGRMLHPSSSRSWEGAGNAMQQAGPKPSAFSSAPRSRMHQPRSKPCCISKLPRIRPQA
jgi:hypothetical protein